MGGVKPSCFCVERERHFESKDIRNMSNKHGETTAKIAGGLQFEGYNVFSDHGTASEHVGKIVSTLEKDYSRKKERNQNILDLANKAKASLGTQNARIGKIVIQTYHDAEEMSAWLPPLVERAVKGEL